MIKIKYQLHGLASSLSCYFTCMTQILSSKSSMSTLLNWAYTLKLE